MISRFFIDRPIFASVLSIVITLAGGIAVFTLPLAQYPSIAPPTVQVDCNFPGASAEVVSQSIAAPIEQQVNGVEGMLYMSSQCTNDGSYNLTVTFNQGVDLNLAQVLVQNRVNLALPALPDVVKQTGVTTRKKSPDILLAVNIYSPDSRYDQLYLSNFTTLYVKDELARVDGVGDVFLFGQRDYSMRVWVDPGRLAHLSLTANDIARELRAQNYEVATGQIGQEPAPAGQARQIPLTTVGRLETVAEFENIIVKSTDDGKIVRLKDVARVELGAKNEALSVQVDRRGSVGLGVFQLPDANALDTAERVIAKMDELKESFPDGIAFQVAYDTTPYTRESIREVFKTLLDAVLLVAAVVLLFLQNWRSAIIPLIAVPVAIIGTFAVMAAFGFTLNNLTLFGLVLAIGIVVDDAIVVVEAVEHHIEHGLAPRQATIKAMEQVSGPVIAVGLVLSAVFVPCAFISGITGQFFKQFALTIAASTIISAFNSLTLSPALSAILLKPRKAACSVARDAAPQAADVHEPLPGILYLPLGAWLGWLLAVPLLPYFADWTMEAHASGALLGAALAWLLRRRLNWLLGKFFAGFNRFFLWSTGVYTRVVGWALTGCVLVLIIYAGMLGLTYWSFNELPRGFIPSQDMGYFLVNVQLPDAASTERTTKVIKHVEEMALNTPGIKHTTAIIGQSFLLGAYGSNFGSVFVLLDDFGQRQTPELYAENIIKSLTDRYREEILDATVLVFGPPPIRGVGRAGGFKIMIEDRADQGPIALQREVDKLIERGSRPGTGVMGLFTVYRANVPFLFAKPDREHAAMMQVPTKEAADTMQIFLGSLYVNDFNRFGRTWQVVVQADAPHRDEVEDVYRLRVRNNKGEMVPLGAMGTATEVSGPLVLMRYNMYPAAAITGSAAPDVSSGEALERMEQIANSELPSNMTFEWTEMAYLEAVAGNTALVIFVLAVVMVFLVLAAQYESWALPLAVILVVPMCILCALAGVAIAKMDINIFTQIGFVVLVGLASKNAILIVEFAKHLREAGIDRREATLEACRLRLRPIVMTSLAFILGVVPLLLAHGAGAEMRRTLGNAVFSGMLGVTLFGLFLTPVFFYVIDRLSATTLFASPEMRLLGTILLHVVGLVFFNVVWLALVAYRMVRKRRRV